MEQTESRLITADDRRLAELVERLVAAYRPERVYLFGSKARGDADRDSDFDILLIAEDDAPPRLRRGRLAYEILWGSGIAADVPVFTWSRFEGSVGVSTSLPATVLREGSPLHVS